MKDFIKILIYRKILNFDKNRENGKVFHFFSKLDYFKSKVCFEDFSTNELEVDFVPDLVIFQ